MEGRRTDILDGEEGEGGIERKLKTTVKVTEYPTLPVGEERVVGPAYSGLITNIHFSSQSPKAPASIEFTIDVAKAKNHNALYLLAENDPIAPKKLRSTETQISRVIILGNEYQVAGRYSLYLENNKLQISFQIANEQGVKIERNILSAFEYALHFACLKYSTDQLIGDKRLSIPNFRKFTVSFHTALITVEYPMSPKGLKMYTTQNLSGDISMNNNHLLPPYLDFSVKTSGVITQARIGSQIQKLINERKLQLQHDERSQ